MPFDWTWLAYAAAIGGIFYIFRNAYQNDAINKEKFLKKEMLPIRASSYTR